MPRPESYPLIAYYRDYVRSLRRESLDGDYAAAMGMPTASVFPNRPESLIVPLDAVVRNPKDATAHFLVGSFAPGEPIPLEVGDGPPAGFSATLSRLGVHVLGCIS